MKIVREIKDYDRYAFTERERKIVNRIIRNINSSNKMQTIYGNYFSVLIDLWSEWGLLHYLFDLGLKVLCCALEENIQHIERGEGKLLCCTEPFLPNVENEEFDIIIVEAPVGGFDTQLVDDDTEYVKFPILHNLIKKASNAPDTYIICFEKYREMKRKCQVVPIVAIPQILTPENIDDLYFIYQQSCYKEFSKLRRSEFNLENKEFKLQNRRNHYTKKEGIILIDSDHAELHYLRGKLLVLEKKYQERNQRIERLEYELQQTSKSLNKCWEILQIYSEINGDNGLDTDLFMKRVIDKTIDEQLIYCEENFLLEKCQSLRTIISEDLFSVVWTKMSMESKQLLLTAIAYLDNSWSFLATGPAICMLAFKTLEIELGRRFVIGYISFLKKIGLKKKTFPTGVLRRNGKKEEILSYDDFTLGNCPYIMGQVGTNGREKKINQDYFVKYCQMELLSDMSKEDIEKWIRKFDSHIRHVKNKYRNPAVHKEMITLDEARDCFKYLYGDKYGNGEKIVINMLKDFTY